MSRTIPLLSLTPVFTALTAIPLLGELPDATQTAGVLLAVLGAMALNSEGSLGGAVRGLLREKGALIMAAVALMWARFPALSTGSRSSTRASISTPRRWLSESESARSRPSPGKAAFRPSAPRGDDARLLLMTTICITVALTFQLLTIRVVLVSLVEAFKRAVGSFTAVVLGCAVFREKVGLREWISVAVMVGGVFLILG